MPRSKPSHESFAHFYLTKVALGEGCGCAEQAARLHELEGARAGGRMSALQMPRVVQQLLIVCAKFGAVLGMGRFRDRDLVGDATAAQNGSKRS